MFTEQEIIRFIEENHIFTGGNTEYAAVILKDLPIKNLTVDDGLLVVEMSRKLRGSEAFVLGKIADEPQEIQDDQVIFRLWFD